MDVKMSSIRLTSIETLHSVVQCVSVYVKLTKYIVLSTALIAIFESFIASFIDTCLFKYEALTRRHIFQYSEM